MPVIYPVVPGNEHNVRDRILAKYNEYHQLLQQGGDRITLQGERYEVITAIAMYNRRLFTDGNQIGRWNTPPTPSQSISLGENTEYDFIIPTSTRIAQLPLVLGPLLGEAKSYSSRLGEYFKKAVGYCLNDPTLGGFCFVTPGKEYPLFMLMVYTTIEILAGREEAPGITGGSTWKRSARQGKPDGPDIVRHFREKYFTNSQYAAPTQQNFLQVLQNDFAGDAIHVQKTVLNEHTQRIQAAHFQRRENQRGTANYYNTEFAQHAGFVIACYMVPDQTDEVLANAIRDLH
jgi:hypothetical protein